MKILKSFFYSGKDFQPPYFWITIFCLLAVVTFILKLTGSEHIETGLLMGVLGFIITWCGIYNWNKKK